MKHRPALVVVAIALITTAHVGSPDTYFEGRAGPYALRVIVRSPGVVPGLAQITIHLLTPNHPARISVLPVFWDPRTQAPPPPDIARRVPGDSSLYDAALWLMRSGAYSVRVSITGPAGEGTVLVPVQALATQRLALRPSLGLPLLALGLLLFAGAVTAARAAARESVLEPGLAPDRRAVRRGRVATGISTVVLALLLLGGRAWWQAVDAAYRTGLYRPAHIALAVRGDRARATLRFTLATDALQADRAFQWTPLIPEHGHLVHLFLVRDSSLAAFAHLHPLPLDSVTFEAPLPVLPAGTYRAYADVVHETGFAQTLTGSVTIPGAFSGARRGDSDDAKWQEHISLSPDSARLEDGSLMLWEERPVPLRIDRDASLRFRVVSRDGRQVALEPYMGLAGHLVLTNVDGSVFVHVHPSGTASVASQQAFLLRQPGDTLRGALAERMATESAMPHDPSGALEDHVAFFYAFPKPGRYRLWVQVKRGGKILTGAFDADVAGAR